MRALRALVITTQDREDINNLVDRAAKKENWFHPANRTEGWLQRVPGNSPAHIHTLFDGYRCVFSYTVIGEQLLRHLSIGVDGEGLPNPQAVLEIGRLFGFTGEVTNPERQLPNSWTIVIKHGDDQIDDRCIVVAQEIEIPA